MSTGVIIGLIVGTEVLLVIALLDLSAWLKWCAVAGAAILLLGMVYDVVVAPL